MAQTAAAALEAVHLTSFKSFSGADLPIDDFTLLVGRNGSGKSNALDGLWALARLATGDDIRDALDGGRAGPEVRGGLLGCPPVGDSKFTLGCTIRVDRLSVHFQVTIETDPVTQVVHERLWTTRLSGPKRGEDRDLLRTDPPDPNRSDIVGRWDNQKRGLNPPVDFRASQLLLTQVATRVPATSAAGREVHDIAAAVIAALRSVFVLDPVPHEMRQYVRRKDSRLRRNADNLSATVAELVRDRANKERLLDLVAGLSESPVVDLRVIDSELDDVMLALVETIGNRSWPVPARQMSDGTLRFLALLAALLQPDEPEGMRGDADPLGQTTLVVEELENGLHPSQAATIIQLLRKEAEEREVRVLATSHSPALLDALPGDLHRSVIVCFRDSTGLSRLCRLTDVDAYLDVADTLRARVAPRPDAEKALRDLFVAS
jgi:predicted ATPase